MSRGTEFPTRLHVRPAKTQISMRFHVVWSESSLAAWRRFGSLANNKVPFEDTEQTARMRKLICILTGRTCNLAEMLWHGLYCNLFSTEILPYKIE